MVADSQASSQISDISRYHGMKLITPTEREARLAMRDFKSGLPILAERLQERAEAENIIITLGTEGIILWGREKGETLMDRLPAFNTAPKDPAGAGDSFLTCASMALVAGADIWQAGYLGELAGGLPGLAGRQHAADAARTFAGNQRPMRALLLAAGMGTRLRPMTEHLPKCLVPIRGKPLL